MVRQTVGERGCSLSYSRGWQQAWVHSHTWLASALHAHTLTYVPCACVRCSVPRSNGRSLRCSQRPTSRVSRSRHAVTLLLHCACCARVTLTAARDATPLWEDVTDRTCSGKLRLRRLQHMLVSPPLTSCVWRRRHGTPAACRQPRRRLSWGWWWFSKIGREPWYAGGRWYSLVARSSLGDPVREAACFAPNRSLRRLSLAWLGLG